MSERFHIARLGAQGDGIAEADKGPLYIPFTLPGERVLADPNGSRAKLLEVEEPSALRVPPPCRHFGECGGCAMQHMQADAYREWKRNIVVDALNSRGIAAPVGELVPCAPNSRRRVVLSARRVESGIVLGFVRALSHTIIGIEECWIARLEIAAALPALRSLARVIGNTDRTFRMIVTSTGSGLDIAVEGSGHLSEQIRKNASDFALRAGVARLSVDGEIVIEPKKPIILFGGVAVSPPPGGFLQAVAEAEEAMASLVTTHFAKAKRVADLFAGSGAFALRLARNSEVHAAEGDAPSLAALDRGFRFSTGLKKVTTERRDLFVRPILAKDLNAYGGIVFDPPRAGAEAQSREIAKSDVPLVAAVSCNPGTLARDLAVLIGGGYAIRNIVLIDQFLWSPHIEAVALLEKSRRRR
jgi:23S rRNA (uracil1939-C5)-methyltransferase